MTDPTLELTPQQRRQRTLDALVLQMVVLSRQNPLLMIFEDAHWADPTSLELFGRIVDSDYSSCFGGSSYQTEMAITATLRFTGLPVR